MYRILSLLILLAYTTACRDASFESRLSADEQKIQKLEERLNTLEYQLGKDRYGTINCAEPQFSRIESNNGAFLIVCEKAEPYLGGYRIHLLVGNPSTLTYQGADLHFSWIENPYVRIINPQAAKTADKAFGGTLQPGSWTPIRFTITPATEEELGNLQVSITAKSVFLQK